MIHINHIKMRKLNINFKLVFIIFLANNIGLYAQSLSTGTLLLEDYYRREQLLGNIDPNFSFVSYPLFPVEAFHRKNLFHPDTTGLDSEKVYGSLELGKGKFVFNILPVIWNQQYNGHHPEGLNDGAMIPARGYQTMFSAGFFIKYGHLSIKIQPEFVYAQNAEYDGFPVTRTNDWWADVLWEQYYDYFLNFIDLPERFGDKAYNKFNWGQSSIRLTYNSISFGFSTENLWWGPGMKNSLLMTNSAPGFAHFTLNTVKPIKTPIGSFEGQIIAGRLRSSGYLPPEHERNINGGPPFYIPKEEGDRYINAMIISYQPKWVPGLFIGLIRSFQEYRKDMDTKLIDYLPILSPYGMESVLGITELDQLKRDPYNSVFFRYVWPESQVEIYGEYGRMDYFWNGRDLMVQMEYSSAYNLGFRKLIPFNNHKKEYFQVHMELTQLSKNAMTILRGGRSWGSSAIVRDGYTNDGQLLGAGIGPGSNVQTLNLSWIRSLKTVGLEFERYAHNEDYFTEKILDTRSHWVDMSAACIVHWDYKNLLFNIKLKAVVSQNYQWLFEPDPTDIWGSLSQDIYNFHGKIGLMYRF